MLGNGTVDDVHVSDSGRLYIAASGLRRGFVRNWQAIGWIVVCLCVTAVLHGYGGEDDKYITYFAARSLAEHGQILNYNGAHLEQSSSLGLVMVLAVLYKILPLSMPTVGYLTSMGLFAVTLALAAAILKRAGVSRYALVVPAIGSVMNYAYWATSGMENTLVTATELWMVYAFVGVIERCNTRRFWWALAATVAFVTTRPESPVISGCLLIGLAVATLLACRCSASRSLSLRGLGHVAVVIIIAVCVTLGFRLAYFHAWVPNPAKLKAAGFNAKDGASYLWEAFAANGPHLFALYLVSMATLLVRLIRRGVATATVVMLACVSGGHLAFVVLSGGDWMGGFRFLSFAVPSLVLASFLVGSRWLVNPSAVAVLSVANLICGLQEMHTGTEARLPLWNARALRTLVQKKIGHLDFPLVEYGNKVHLRDTVTLTRFLPVVDRIVAASGDRPIWIMTGQAGIMPYYTVSRHFGRVKIMDLWSLTSLELYNCFPKNTLAVGGAGTGIGAEGAFTRLEKFGAQCGMPVPDIYYNEGLTQDMRDALEKHGYVLLYEQAGTMRVQKDKTFLPSTVDACGHFAVRRELVNKLELKTLATDDWNTISVR
jgi:hypothetical protein